MSHPNRNRFSKRALVIATILVVMLILLIPSCNKDGKSRSSASQKLYVYNWTYYTPDEVIKRFEQEYNVEVVLDNFSSNEEMFAKIMAGGSKGYDVIFPSADYTSIMIKLGLVQKLDHEKLPNLEYVTDFIREKIIYDPQLEYSVPYNLGVAGIMVNTTKVADDYPRTWDIFNDARYNQRMSMLDDMRETMGVALRYLGYSVNTSNEAELEAAKNLIITKWKPNLIKFDAESFGKAFSSGEFWIVHGYPENVYEEFPESRWDEIAFILPPEGGPMAIDNMVIPTSANNVDLAHAFINFIHNPEIYALFLDEFHYPAIVNVAAEAYMETESFYSIDQLGNYEVMVDLDEDLDKYNAVWRTIRYTN